MSFRHIIAIMKKRNKTKFVILGLLTIAPLSGYGIKSLIDKSITYFWSESNGQIYPTLNLLLKEKLIILKERQSVGKKIRNIYTITKQGTIELKKWLNTLAEKNIHRDETLLKLFFGGASSIKESIKHLQTRKKEIEKNLKNYHLIQKMIQTQEDSPHNIYWLICLRNGLISAKADLKWCKESIKTLEEHKQ